MSFDFFENEQAATLAHAARKPSTTPDPGVFDGFWAGAGQYAMRSLAESGRAVSMASAAIPITADKLLSGDNLSGQSLTDQYFRLHNEVFNNAVDHWTPRPGEVGTAGQIAGQLAGGVMQAIVSPVLLVGTTQLSSAEDLVRAGVDAGTANAVGAVQGAGMAVGIKLPFLGKSLATRVLSGVGGNLAQGFATAAASETILKDAGYDQQAERFDPWDMRARLLDTMLGAAFGGLAHVGAKSEAKLPPLTPTDEAALLVVNQARHIEDRAPGIPLSDVDATKHAKAMQEAVGQILRGDDVSVDHIVKDMQTDAGDAWAARHTEMQAELQRLIDEGPSHDPIVVSPKAGAAVNLTENDLSLPPNAMKGRTTALDNPDMLIHTGEIAPDGSLVTINAHDAIAQADAQVTHAKSTAQQVFMTAAHCLLGTI